MDIIGNRALNSGDPEEPIRNSQPAAPMPLIGNSHQDMSQGLSFNLSDYIELADWSSSLNNVSNCLRALGIDAKAWPFTSFF